MDSQNRVASMAYGSPSTAAGRGAAASTAGNRHHWSAHHLQHRCLRANHLRGPPGRFPRNVRIRCQRVPERGANAVRLHHKRHLQCRRPARSLLRRACNAGLQPSNTTSITTRPPSSTRWAWFDRTDAPQRHRPGRPAWPPPNDDIRRLRPAGVHPGWPGPNHDKFVRSVRQRRLGSIFGWRNRHKHLGRIQPPRRGNRPTFQNHFLCLRRRG